MKITLQGKEYEVVLPDFSTREELLLACRETQESENPAIFRALSAVLGLCTPLGRELGVDYLRAKCNPYAYGGTAYAILRERGVEPQAIVDAAKPVVRVLRESRFPSKSEVGVARDFSNPAEAGQIERPSNSP